MQTYVKKDVLNRLKTIRGHLNHVVQAVEQEKYCIDILQQSLAVQAALRIVDSIILKGHFEEHVSQAMQKKGKSQQQSIKEIVDLFQKGRR